MSEQAAIFEVPPAPTPPRPAHNAREIQKLYAEIEDLEGQIEWLQEDIERAHEKIERLRKGDLEWPDRATLLAVYGAPGHWPVEAAA